MFFSGGPDTNFLSFLQSIKTVTEQCEIRKLKTFSNATLKWLFINMEISFVILTHRQTYICMHVPWGVHKHSSYTHKWTQSSSIYKKLWSPQISLRQDQIFADLFGFYLHIHLSFFRFPSKCVSTRTRAAVRALCKQCLLRRWIKQQAHLICTTLRGKCAHTRACIQHQNHFRHRSYS